ncbi:hypothetical protein Hanom_Chr04g00384171 [Helianthus anomalus]
MSLPETPSLTETSPASIFTSSVTVVIRDGGISTHSLHAMLSDKHQRVLLSISRHSGPSPLPLRCLPPMLFPIPPCRRRTNSTWW